MVLLLRQDFIASAFDEEILEQFQLDTSLEVLSRQIGSFTDYCIINTDNSKTLEQVSDLNSKAYTNSSNFEIFKQK